MSDVRKWTCLVLDGVEEGILDPMMMLRAALCYMSESEVEDMCRVNDLLQYLEPEAEEEEVDPEDALNNPNSVSWRGHY